MFLGHMIVILSSVWGNGATLPQAPTEGSAIVMRYSPKEHSKKGRQPWSNIRKELDGVEPIATSKHW